MALNLARTPLSKSLTIAAICAITLAMAFTIEAVGYKPCELCLEQRLAFYGGFVAAILAAFSSYRGANVAAGALLVFIMGAFFDNTALAIYHSGVEMKFWLGPDACTGAIAGPIKAADLLNALKTIKIVRCDEVRLRILGLSMANWNVFLSFALALLALKGAYQIWNQTRNARSSHKTK